ncbi:MAG: hypothetical protein KJZ78_28025, partial [Bryobacteraceae bacterium]|nr:hypothetical protein [Bryobacteraceae bacterium]
GATWGNALAEYDLGGPDRFDKFLAKQGAAGLAAAYRRAMMPLSPEEEADFRERLSRALREHSWSLLNRSGSMGSLRHLTPEHLLPGPGGWGDATEANVRQCIQDVDWTDRQRPFQPNFTCREHHFRLWQAWLNANDRRERLLNWAASLQVSNQNVQIAGVEKLRAAAIADRLDSPAEESLSRLAFNPEQNAWQWLSEAVPDLDSKLDQAKRDCIDRLLPPLQRYLPVRAIQSWGDWKPQPFRLVGPTEAVLAPINPDEVAAEAVAKLAVGVDAEHALRHFVAEQTMALLRNHGDYAWKMLIEALPTRGRTRRDLESVRKDCTAESLAHALHISRTWGSAGYDILGLEASADGEPCVPVRYEVKGLPKRGSSIRVFLSPNELAVYRRVSLNGSGVTADPRYRGWWRLVGVWPEGLAMDLTDSLKPLLDGQAGPLAELGKHGLSPQGLILTLTR